MERQRRRMHSLRGLRLLSPRPRGNPAAARAARGARQPVAGETLCSGRRTLRQDRPRRRDHAGLHGGRDALVAHPAAVRDAAQPAGAATPHARICSFEIGVAMELLRLALRWFRLQAEQVKCVRRVSATDARLSYRITLENVLIFLVFFCHFLDEPLKGENNKAIEISIGSTITSDYVAREDKFTTINEIGERSVHITRVSSKRSDPVIGVAFNYYMKRKYYINLGVHHRRLVQRVEQYPPEGTVSADTYYDHIFEIPISINRKFDLPTNPYIGIGTMVRVGETYDNLLLGLSLLVGTTFRLNSIYMSPQSRYVRWMDGASYRKTDQLQVMIVFRM